MPDIHKSAFVAPTAFVSGNVTIGPDASLWPGASLRGDMGLIVIGAGTSVQDNCSLHEQPGGSVVVGDICTVGHGAVLHGCTVGNCTVIGMNATVLDGAAIGNCCIVAAGAVVRTGTVVPDHSLVVGNPAEIKEGRVKDLTMNWYGALLYIAMARRYRDGILSWPHDALLAEAEELKRLYPLPA